MNDIYAALAAIQKQLHVGKTRENKHLNAKYRNAEDILSAAKPLCAEHGLCLLLSEDIVQRGDRYYVQSTASVRTADGVIECTAYAREQESKKGVIDSAMITGASTSYARKYALGGLFAIDDNDDVDSFDARQTDRTPPEPTPSDKAIVDRYHAEIWACPDIASLEDCAASYIHEPGLTPDGRKHLDEQRHQRARQIQSQGG